ncbi:hypothetical protein ENU1_206370 [Entamoeba nuttalli P19]|uniref:Transmembrane protein n=1 Tax=Entamoeba nuttalli (strain P19) TaxID=1076696 RepID=K2G4J0_ENTNP|nr:hypothetical protein ENU1_206370 [Entamoeba nuttalli P19]EKE37181.1 hypothetical protein ENU1_206370 [Entamoeba nuttalli P19]|eukprot:XP_008860484.1 hypothetical protein ENU1_206370 [Entamoeba nuttalli P19]
MGDSEQQDIETINSQQQEIQVNNETTGSQQQEKEENIEIPEYQETSKVQNKKGCCSCTQRECDKSEPSFCSLLSSIPGIVSITCQIQLLIFTNGILIGIFVLFIISTGHLILDSTISIWYKIVYGYVMVYGSLLLIELIYYFILFSIEYVCRSHGYLFGDEKSNDNESKTCCNGCNGNRYCLIEILIRVIGFIFHYIGIIALVFGVIAGLIAGLCITKKHGEPSVLTYMGYCYLLIGLIGNAIAFVVFVIAKFVYKLLYYISNNCSCKSEDKMDICIKAIIYLFPFSFIIIWIINLFVECCCKCCCKKCSEKATKITSGIIGVIFVLFFIFFLIFATVHSHKNDGHIGWYWLIFIFHGYLDLFHQFQH